MRSTISAAVVVMLCGGAAYAQGGPSERMQAPSAREQGTGEPGMRGNDNSSGTQSREESQGSKAKKAEGKQSQDKQSQDKSSKSASDKDKQPSRAETEDKGNEKVQDRAEDRSRGDTNKSSQTTEERKGTTERDNSAEKKTTEQPSDTTKQATTGDRNGKNVNLSGDKQDRVKTALREKSDVKHRTNVNIDLRVGTRLPRDFDFVVVPESVVAIVPEYRGYLFAYVDDDYVICDPQTYEVVAVIPATAGGPNYASDHSSGRCSDQLSLTADDKDLVVRSISREGRGRTVDVRDLRPGWSVPRDVELLKFPDPVLDRVGELSSCRYFVAEDKIAIVSPDDEKVVAVIDKS